MQPMKTFPHQNISFYVKIIFF